ncbi:MAG: bi-domain-containing oxidoreductase [Gammaproteobacteria bacterium]|nr:bi-domain-containing oxidoreductase [Gammaproteobacteria bacterium]MCP5135999.1 bi-domain-containing oxidoreductase [Gammaproteobacteria bacterium]
MISVGTEIASLRPSGGGGIEGTPVEKAKAYSVLAKTYLGLAARNPGKAARRVARIAKSVAGRVVPPRSQPQIPAITMGDMSWTRANATEFSIDGGVLRVVTDASEAAYQVISSPFAVSEGMVPVVRVSGEVVRGQLAIGVLNEAQDTWLGNRSYEMGRFEDRLIFAPKGSDAITLVIANAGAGAPAELVLNSLEVSMEVPSEGGLPLSELEDQGWNVGYSAAGEVIAVGDAVTDLVPGDYVACGGAGKANHADFVSVPRNLVCKIPAGCSVRDASTTTVGTIALQGVRRTQPEIGETIAVIGLGLLGQMTAQMLRANGCTVVGLDLDASRVLRARKLGMDAGESDVDVYKALIRDMTGGRGADRVVITAATKSDAVINLAMEVCRAKGRVVIVGDVGLNVARPQFYRKEIDLVMSTSYGAGRYDRNYEENGVDYPFAYVRWTLNRNMSSYMALIASGRLNVAGLIDKVVTVDEAPETYAKLAASDDAPLGVLLRFPDDGAELAEPHDAAKITIRGSRKPLDRVINYALIGAGAFGISMLVPQMQKRKDRYFLRGVVSRSGLQASNFVRANQIEVLASDLDEVLKDPDMDMVVIATRHNEHATQVIRSLKAGKHVFVEKPIALNWDELGELVDAYQALSNPPALMVGFNRRFSPALVALREVLANRRSPVIINYRLNGGYIPIDSWIQNEQGGGRNIGEACHMYDVFRSIAGAPVASIAANSINPGDAPYLRNDNFCATLTYQDGSVGNLVYTALGPKQGMPKERIEVFCDGEAYVVDDYKSLTRASDGKVLWSGDVDKGHYEELSQLADAIHDGRGAPISFNEIIETTAASLHVEDLLFGRVIDDEE